MRSFNFSDDLVDVEATSGMIADLSDPKNTPSSSSSRHDASSSSPDFNNGSSMPTADDVRTEIANEQTRVKQNSLKIESRSLAKRFFPISILVALLLIAGLVALGTSLGLKRNNDGDQSSLSTESEGQASNSVNRTSDDPTISTTSTITLRPQVSPEPRQTTVNDVVDFLLRFNVSSESSLRNSSSSQYAAASWIANDDAANLKVPSNYTLNNYGGMYLLTNDPAVYSYITRYVLVLSFFVFDVPFFLHLISGLGICRHFNCDGNQQLQSFAFRK
jgi:hypothetical protein